MIYGKKIPEEPIGNKKLINNLLNYIKCLFSFIKYFFSLLDSPFDELIPFQRALKSIVTSINTNFGKDHEFFIGFEGSFGRKHTTPRTLTSKFLGSMVCVEGIVVRCKSINFLINN